MDDEMIDDRPARRIRSRLRRYVGLAAGAVALLVLGAAGGIIWSERYGGGARAKRVAPARDAQAPAASPGGASMPGMPAPAGPAKTEETIELSLTPEAIERAGIRIAEVKSQTSVSVMTVPGTVMSNAYRDTKVNALVGGIVRQVTVALGSASRQELEEVTAVHTGHETEVAAARQRLLLLGLSADRVAKLESASQVVSEVTVSSPADGL